MSIWNWHAHLLANPEILHLGLSMPHLLAAGSPSAVYLFATLLLAALHGSPSNPHTEEAMC